MVLFTLLGAAARQWLGWQPGVGAGLLAGFLVATFVPAKTACGGTSAPVDPGSR